MFRRQLHLNCRLLAMAAIAIPLLSTGGCAMFRKNVWNMDRYRDERAVDIDRRLEKNAPIMKNPF